MSPHPESTAPAIIAVRIGTVLLRTDTGGAAEIVVFRTGRVIGHAFSRPGGGPIFKPSEFTHLESGMLRDIADLLDAHTSDGSAAGRLVAKDQP